MKQLKIAEVFSETPGGRYIKDGAFSGELFRNTILLPVFDKLNDNEKLCIDLDGGYGYAVSFLEEAFGGLARVRNVDQVLKKLEFVSNEEPNLIDEIRKYIENANK